MHYILFHVMYVFNFEKLLENLKFILKHDWFLFCFFFTEGNPILHFHKRKKGKNEKKKNN